MILKLERATVTGMLQLEHDSVEHGPQTLNDVVGHNCLNILLQVLLRIQFSHLDRKKLVKGKNSENVHFECNLYQSYFACV